MTEYVLMIVCMPSDATTEEAVRRFIEQEITDGPLYFNTKATTTRLHKHLPGGSSSDIIAFKFERWGNFYVFTTFYADQWIKFAINDLERLLIASVQTKFKTPVTVLCKLMKVIDRGQLGNCNF